MKYTDILEKSIRPLIRQLSYSFRLPNADYNDRASFRHRVKLHEHEILIVGWLSRSVEDGHCIVIFDPIEFISTDSLKSGEIGPYKGKCGAVFDIWFEFYTKNSKAIDGEAGNKFSILRKYVKRT